MNFSNNTESSVYWTQICDESQPLCLDAAFESTSNVANVFGLLINGLHVIVLSRFYRKSQSSYLRLMQAIAVSDILNCITTMLTSSCPLRQQLINRSFYYSVVPVSASNAFAVWRYYLLVWATVDRFTAVCRPYDYSSSWLSTRMAPVICGSFIIFSMCASVTREALFASTICIDMLRGPLYLYPKPLAPSIYLYALVGSRILIIIGLSSAVLVEMCRMRRRSLSVQQDEVKRGAQYVVSVNALFSLCQIILFILASIDESTHTVPVGLKVSLSYSYVPTNILWDDK